MTVGLSQCTPCLWVRQVVGHTFQRLQQPDPRTYIGSGKTAEIQAAIVELGVQTVIFDDELSPGQQRSLERALGDGVRLCDRTALILDIFSQRAATREGHLQVHLDGHPVIITLLGRCWPLCPLMPALGSCRLQLSCLRNTH